MPLASPTSQIRFYKDIPSSTIQTPTTTTIYSIHIYTDLLQLQTPFVVSRTNHNISAATPSCHTFTSIVLIPLITLIHHHPFSHHDHPSPSDAWLRKTMDTTNVICVASILIRRLFPPPRGLNIPVLAVWDQQVPIAGPNCKRDTPGPQTHHSGPQLASPRGRLTPRRLR